MPGGAFPDEPAACPPSPLLGAAALTESGHSAAALERGLLLRPISNTLYAMPPYLLDEEAVLHLAASALAALEDTLAQENHS